MPSATAYRAISLLHRKLSSLWFRFRPTSVAPQPMTRICPERLPYARRRRHCGWRGRGGSRRFRGGRRFRRSRRRRGGRRGGFGGSGRRLGGGGRGLCPGGGGRACCGRGGGRGRGGC